MAIHKGFSISYYLLPQLKTGFMGIPLNKLLTLQKSILEALDSTVPVPNIT